MSAPQSLDSLHFCSTFFEVGFKFANVNEVRRWRDKSLTLNPFLFCFYCFNHLQILNSQFWPLFAMHHSKVWGTSSKELQSRSKFRCQHSELHHHFSHTHCFFLKCNSPLIVLETNSRIWKTCCHLAVEFFMVFATFIFFMSLVFITML